MDTIEAKVLTEKTRIDYKGDLDKGLAVLFACIPSAARRQAIINEIQATHNRIVRERWEEATK